MQRITLLVMVLFVPMLVLASSDLLVGGRTPALSPDGSTIALSYMGDIWLVSSQGGKAYRLTI
ncbi:hypothetical protein AMJ86_08755, partial [bacterium SM23_57]